MTEEDDTGGPAQNTRQAEQARQRRMMEELFEGTMEEERVRIEELYRNGFAKQVEEMRTKFETEVEGRVQEILAQREQGSLDVGSVESQDRNENSNNEGRCNRHEKGNTQKDEPDYKGNFPGAVVRKGSFEADIMYAVSRAEN